MTKQYIIIGNGVAGISAAQEIHALDPTSRILMFGKENKPYYYRASLSEWLSGKNTIDMLTGRTEDFYPALNIDFSSEHVDRIDPTQKTIFTRQKQYRYDELLIATGAAANRVSVPGIEKPLVYRDMRDTTQLQDALKKSRRILILGGGVLGLELAASVHDLGSKDIAIVQHSSYLGKPLLDKTASDWLIQRMTADGITIFLNDSVTHAEGQTAFLNSGKTWDFDCFVLTIGVHPVYPETPGLQIDNGIRIDEHCCTNLSHIYAAGDCTQVYHPEIKSWLPTRIWLDCTQQGKTAGQNMARKEATLPSRPYYNASYIYSDTYVYIGAPHADSGEVVLWKTNHAYRKFRVEEGKIAGALLLNNRRGHLPILRAIENKVAIPTHPQIAKPEFEWNELTGQDWDYYFF